MKRRRRRLLAIRGFPPPLARSAPTSQGEPHTAGAAPSPLGIPKEGGRQLFPLAVHQLLLLLFPAWVRALSETRFSRRLPLPKSRRIYSRCPPSPLFLLLPLLLLLFITCPSLSRPLWRRSPSRQPASCLHTRRSAPSARLHHNLTEPHRQTHTQEYRVSHLTWLLFPAAPFLFLSSPTTLARDAQASPPVCAPSLLVSQPANHPPCSPCQLTTHPHSLAKREEGGGGAHTRARRAEPLSLARRAPLQTGTRSKLHSR